MTKPASWATKYIGIPFVVKGRTQAGCDCWGLVRLVLEEQFKVKIPSYSDDYESIEDWKHLSKLIESRIPEWVPVLPNARCAGDVVLIRARGLPIHIGILASRIWMLHTDRKTSVCLERIEGITFTYRVLGYYRHVELANAN